jgi:glutathione S-transferase
MRPLALNAILQVLGRASSIHGRKVLWTCDELGLEPEGGDWGAGSLSLRSPEFLALKPNALVPVWSSGWNRRPSG